MTGQHLPKLRRKEQRESQDTEREEDPSVQASVHHAPHPVREHAGKVRESAEDPLRALLDPRDSLPKDLQDLRAREDPLMFREDRAHTP